MLAHERAGDEKSDVGRIDASVIWLKIVDEHVCAANGDDPLRAAIKSNPRMDNTSLTIVVPAIFAWLDASVLDCACWRRVLALVS